MAQLYQKCVTSKESQMTSDKEFRSILGNLGLDGFAQESMKKYYDPIKQLQELMTPAYLKDSALEQVKNFVNPYKSIQDLVSPLSFNSSIVDQVGMATNSQIFIQEKNKQFRDLINPVLSSSSVLDQIGKATSHQSLFFNQAKIFQDLINPVLSSKSVLDQVGMATSQHNSILEQAKKVQDLVNPMSLSSSILDQVSGAANYKSFIQDVMSSLSLNNSIIEIMNKTFRADSLIQEQMNKFLYPLNNYLSDPLMSSVSAIGDGSFYVGNEIVSAESVSEFMENIPFDNESGIDFISYFFEWIEKNYATVKPKVVFVALYIFLPYFLTIYGNLTTPYWENKVKKYNSPEIRTVKKEVIKEVRDIYSAEDLQGYRFVATNILHVRENSSTSSEIIDDIYLGKTVKIIEKIKSWCLIEYQDPDTNEVKQGWVFLRYLTRFSR
jgi:hypothetical protein